MIIPQQVYNELSDPCIPHLKERVDEMIRNGDISIRSILTGTPEFSLYMKLTSNPDNGQRIIGRGEASVIALASSLSGIVASNNLSDIKTYAKELGLKHITTGDIMIVAYKGSLISETDGNNIWSAMLAKKRRVGSSSFTKYLSLHDNTEYTR